MPSTFIHEKMVKDNDNTNTGTATDMALPLATDTFVWS